MFYFGASNETSVDFVSDDPRGSNTHVNHWLFTVSPLQPHTVE